MFVAPRNSSSQSATRATFDWTVINEELFSLTSPVKEALNCDAISTDKAASAFPDLIGAHLRNSGILVDDSPPGPHRDLVSSPDPSLRGGAYRLEIISAPSERVW